MSKEFAEELDLDPIPEDKQRELEKLMDEKQSLDISRKELDERIEAVREGERPSILVSSWDDLWGDYR